MHPSEIWHSQDPAARVLRGALTPASWLYAAGWETYLAIYRLGIKRAQAPHRPVVCIGNLLVGGTGKSPMTRHVANVLREIGREVVVSTSGYGSPAAEAATVAPPGPLSASEWGDEPAMLRWLEPELPLIVGRRRVLAAELANRHFPNAVMLMDDGFQHLPLAKDVTIVLDPPDPANRRCLPAGPYREPRRHRRRADLVLPNQQFEIASAPMELRTPDGEPQSPGAYGVLCALGQPERFLTELGRQHPNHAAHPWVRTLGDHDRLDVGNLFADVPADLPIVVTAKDWVKLRERSDIVKHAILIASQDVHVAPEAAFREWLGNQLNG